MLFNSLSFIRTYTVLIIDNYYLYFYEIYLLVNIDSKGRRFNWL